MLEDLAAATPGMSTAEATQQKSGIMGMYVNGKDALQEKYLQALYEPILALTWRFKQQSRGQTWPSAEGALPSLLPCMNSRVSEKLVGASKIRITFSSETLA